MNMTPLAGHAIDANETRLTPERATRALLASMAFRIRHDFGLLDAGDQRALLARLGPIHDAILAACDPADGPAARPDEVLLDRMARLWRPDFDALDEDARETALCDMGRVYEEAAGQGYFSLSRAGMYLSLLGGQ